MATSTDDNAAYGNSAKRNIRLIKADHTRNGFEWFFQKWLINRTFSSEWTRWKKAVWRNANAKAEIERTKTEKTERKQD